MSVIDEFEAGERERGWLLEAIKTQGRVIGALVMRETRTRFGKSQLGYFWALAEPVGYVMFLSVIFGAINRHAPFGASMSLFFATGVLPFLLFNNIAKAVSSAFDANEALLSFPIVKPVDTLVARAILETATMLAVMIITLSIIVVTGGLHGPANLWIIAEAIIGLCLAGFGLGSINAVVMKLAGSWRNLYDVLTKPLMLFSGVFFLPDAMPQAVRDILSYLPTLQGIELFRSGFYEGYRSSVLDPGYLFAVGLVLCLLGLSGERILRLRAA